MSRSVNNSANTKGPVQCEGEKKHFALSLSLSPSMLLKNLDKYFPTAQKGKTTFPPPPLVPPVFTVNFSLVYSVYLFTFSFIFAHKR